MNNMFTDEEKQLVANELKDNYIDESLTKAAKLAKVFTTINITIYPFALIIAAIIITIPSGINDLISTIFFLFIFSLLFASFIFSFLVRNEATRILLGTAEDKTKLQKYAYFVNPWIMVKRVKQGKYINKWRWEQLKKELETESE